MKHWLPIFQSRLSLHQTYSVEDCVRYRYALGYVLASAYVPPDGPTSLPRFVDTVSHVHPRTQRRTSHQESRRDKSGTHPAGPKRRLKEEIVYSWRDSFIQKSRTSTLYSCMIIYPHKQGGRGRHLVEGYKERMFKLTSIPSAWGTDKGI
jgi:hypothetical protein